MTALSSVMVATDQALLGTSKPTFAGITLTAAANEAEVSLSGTTPAITGVVNRWTLTGNSTPTSSLNNGDSAIVLIDDGTAYTITWTMVDQWIGGVAPTLATTGYSVIILFKTNDVIYGNHSGDLS